MLVWEEVCLSFGNRRSLGRRLSFRILIRKMGLRWRNIISFWRKSIRVILLLLIYCQRRSHHRKSWKMYLFLLFLEILILSLQSITQLTLHFLWLPRWDKIRIKLKQNNRFLHKIPHIIPLPIIKLPLHWSLHQQNLPSTSNVPLPLSKSNKNKLFGLYRSHQCSHVQNMRTLPITSF